MHSSLNYPLIKFLIDSHRKTQPKVLLNSALKISQSNFRSTGFAIKLGRLKRSIEFTQLMPRFGLDAHRRKGYLCYLVPLRAAEKLP